MRGLKSPWEGKLSKAERKRLDKIKKTGLVGGGRTKKIKVY